MVVTEPKLALQQGDGISDVDASIRRLAFRLVVLVAEDQIDHRLSGLERTEDGQRFGTAEVDRAHSVNLEARSSKGNEVH